MAYGLGKLSLNGLNVLMERIRAPKLMARCFIDYPVLSNNMLPRHLPVANGGLWDSVRKPMVGSRVSKRHQSSLSRPQTWAC